jgi:hypothetical protein
MNPYNEENLRPSCNDCNTSLPPHDEPTSNCRGILTYEDRRNVQCLSHGVPGTWYEVRLIYDLFCTCNGA